MPIALGSCSHKAVKIRKRRKANLGSPSSVFRSPANGARVNLNDCSISGEGAAELRALWQDPEYDATERALYYVRVLENPTCRWSTWDAIRAGVTPRADLHATIQERAWSSPIWLSAAPGQTH